MWEVFPESGSMAAVGNLVTMLRVVFSERTGGQKLGREALRSHWGQQEASGPLLVRCEVCRYEVGEMRRHQAVGPV